MLTLHDVLCIVLVCLAVACFTWFTIFVEQEKKRGRESGSKEIEIQVLGIFKVRIALDKNEEL